MMAHRGLVKGGLICKNDFSAGGLFEEGLFGGEGLFSGVMAGVLPSFLKL